MTRQKAGSHVISGAFVFLLLGVFALFAVIMVLLGAGAYNRSVESAAAHHEARIAPAYLRTMVRGHDEAGGVRVEALTGILREDEDTGEVRTEPVDLDAIVMEDDAAVTRIFVYDGWLYECSEPKEDDWTSDGEAVFDDDGDVFFGEDDWIFEDEEEPAADDETVPAGVCLGSRMQPVCEAEEMQAERTGSLLTIRLRSGETWRTLVCSLHSEEP